MAADSPFLTDVKELRRRARMQLEEGAVTEGYKLDRDRVITLLNAALATEVVCVLRYQRHYFMACGLESSAVAEEFLEHANEEQMHAMQIARRIAELNGAPDFNPEGLRSRSHSEYVEGTSLVDMIREDLIAERIAIESYRELVTFFGDKDPTSRRIMEAILQKEEEHAEDLAELLRRQTTIKPGAKTK